MSENGDLMGEAVQFDALEFDVYERSKANILRLKERLPDDLVANLAREVIRRVVSKGSEVAEFEDRPSQAELKELAFALISKDDTRAPDLIQSLRKQGKTAEAIYLYSLAASARMLGDWWDEDKISFTQVALGAGRVFAIMRSMRHLFEPSSISFGKSAIFASVPGETHTLGVRMAADLFRKEGWDIALKVGLDHDALVAEIEQTPDAIVGLSISGEHSVEALSKLVVAINISCPHVKLFVSGQNIEDAKPMLELMDLDGVTSDVEEAKAMIAKLWDQRRKA